MTIKVIIKFVIMKAVKLKCGWECREGRGRYLHARKIENKTRHEWKINTVKFYNIHVFFFLSLSHAQRNKTNTRRDMSFSSDWAIGLQQVSRAAVTPTIRYTCGGHRASGSKSAPQYTQPDHWPPLSDALGLPYVGHCVLPKCEKIMRGNARMVLYIRGCEQKYRYVNEYGRV